MDRSGHLPKEQQPPSSEVDKSEGRDLEAAMQYMDPDFRDWLKKQMSNTTSENVSSKPSNCSLGHVNCIGVYATGLDESGNLKNIPKRIPTFLPRSILKDVSGPVSIIHEIKEISSSEDTNTNLVDAHDDVDQGFNDNINDTSYWDICESKRKESDLEAKKIALEKSILYNSKDVETLLTNVRPTNWNWRDNDGKCTTLPIPKPEPQTVLEISREPIHCPHCGSILSPSAVMYHFLMQHVRNEEIFFIEIHLKQRCLYLFEPLKFEFRKNFALSLFAYGSHKTENNNGQLISRRLALPNAPLPPEFKSLQNYSPIILMACRTSWAALFGTHELDEQLSADHEETNDLWVFWLVSSETVIPVYASITVFSRAFDDSLSRVVRVRKLNDSQQCYDFLNLDCNHLDLGFPGAKSMSNDFTCPITLEILFNER